MGEVRVVYMRARVPEPNAVVVNATSRAVGWSSALSPFRLGPCSLYGGRESLNMENAWQYAKVYPCHADERGNPTEAYWAWAEDGWSKPEGVRFPMGRPAPKPLYSLWGERRLDYIGARKAIYAPLYARAVQKTEAFRTLRQLHAESDLLVLRDWDGYDLSKANMSLTRALYDSRKPFAHSFVLAALLTNDPVLERFEL